MIPPKPTLVMSVEPDGSLIPKRDGKGRIYREVRCEKCRAFLCDEYIRSGRLRLKCFRCGRITVMTFRPYREPK